ncbi:NB-ARC domain-containing protein [Micromonospora sp. WMMD1102]|uniref:NB-ARC domain-containing protein n=1 Tax=Micromonospora sp. WMMD1102 TaxID=3016105 RepID=UPI00241509E1|nr:NB-ARC domain-containing protein [Micromonospora sp. WMMD1102]MDG4791399.1 NB-ARC domain-containing protein [Micromonospora sp. WMMD1102]
MLRDVASRPPATVALHGAPGLGKSTLVLRVAHQLVARFADGQLYINLQGATPDTRPLSPLDALGRLLRAFGSGDEIPAAVDQAAALFRSITADRQVLVILDNALDSAQVRALLPAGGGCTTLVTCRRPLLLPGMTAQLPVDRLPDDEAVQLLRAYTGTRRDDLGQDEAGGISELCERLPLALCLAGTRLAHRPDLSTSALAARLADERYRLDELRHGDVAIRSSLAVGYLALAESESESEQLAARAFRAIGKLHLTDFDPMLVAVILELPTERATHVVDCLVGTHLAVHGATAATGCTTWSGSTPPSCPSTSRNRCSTASYDTCSVRPASPVTCCGRSAITSPRHPSWAPPVPRRLRWPIPRMRSGGSSPNGPICSPWPRRPRTMPGRSAGSPIGFTWRSTAT